MIRDGGPQPRRVCRHEYIGRLASIAFAWLQPDSLYEKNGTGRDTALSFEENMQFPRWPSGEPLSDVGGRPASGEDSLLAPGRSQASEAQYHTASTKLRVCLGARWHRGARVQHVEHSPGREAGGEDD